MTTVDLHARAVEALAAEVVSGRWAPGRSLRGEDLARALGVSRSVTREAVRVLETLGLVSSRKRIGVKVLPSSQWLDLDPRVLRWKVTHDPDLAAVRRTHASLVAVVLGLAPVAAAAAAGSADSGEVATIAAAAVALVASPEALALARLVLTVVEAAHDPIFSAVSDAVATSEGWAGAVHDLTIDASAAMRVAVAIQRGSGLDAMAAMRDLVTPIVLEAGHAA